MLRKLNYINKSWFTKTITIINYSLSYLICVVVEGKALRFLFKGTEEFWVLIINNNKINKKIYLKIKTFRVYKIYFKSKENMQLCKVIIIIQK